MNLIEQLAHESTQTATSKCCCQALSTRATPFPSIARYRQGSHGRVSRRRRSRALADERLSYLRNLERKEDAISLIDAQGKLTPELE